MTRSFGWFEIYMQDVERAKRFYETGTPRQPGFSAHLGESIDAEDQQRLEDTAAYRVVRVDVDEIDAQRVTVGAPLTIRVEGSPEQVQGRAVSPSPKMRRNNLLVETPATRNDVRIREVLVETAAGRPLLPGSRVRVQFGASSASFGGLAKLEYVACCSENRKSYRSLGPTRTALSGLYRSGLLAWNACRTKRIRVANEGLGGRPQRPL